MPYDTDASLADASRRPTRAEALSAELARAITDGRLPPGTALEEERLAAAHGVSRTPVREALRLLASTGLVEQRPRRGAVVARPEPHRLAEMFQAMAELEASCASLCTKAMSKAAKARLASRHAAMEQLAQTGHLEAYREANVAFHEAIYAGAGNGYLAELAGATRRRLAPFRAAQLGGRDRLAASHAEHGAIVAAILAGDPAAAAAAVRAHLAATEGAWGMMAGQPPRRLG
ncbi:GntR family transcriptional regulator [Roseomonas eburnea]|uniref:GntR family transcriptional regulator n=1 Tax=Neoroseomonas eburnea TaxID=1346889 RepID=A0A9X9X872_9PROT|nr:GntR family transcriptional regulator [Neoroseomonas eburnea]MBR0679908.1 GntR family transcriptional regulator [Neoroseomonas eburnea]